MKNQARPVQNRFARTEVLHRLYDKIYNVFDHVVQNFLLALVTNCCYFLLDSVIFLVGGIQTDSYIGTGGNRQEVLVRQ